MRRRRVSGAAVVFALLVIATLGAFAYSQNRKRDPILVDRVTIGTEQSRAFTPNNDCVFDRIRIRFRTTTSNDATVQVIEPGGRLVATLARDVFLKRYRFHTFYWGGRDREGGEAPPGRYKLRIVLYDDDRVLVPPGTIRLHDAEPNVLHGCTKNAQLPSRDLPAEPGP